MLKKLPPLEKIYEAWSAIGSGRIRLLTPADAEKGAAELLSSDASKAYRLSWDGNDYRSDDNMTVWQGSPGYPILALLMLRGLLPLPEDAAKALAPVNWGALNKEAKGDWAQAAEKAFQELKLSPETAASLKKLAKEACCRLAELDITAGRWRKPKKTG